MKHLKSYNENNNSELISKLDKFRIENYTINSDGSIDVNGDVDLYDRELVSIPFNFRNVTGHFHISHNKLTSLKGCPRDVGGYFECTFKLTKLL